MSGLASITTGRQVEPRKILLYGVHGIGKTTFGACAPNPIFLPTEEGTNDLDVARFPLATSAGQLMSNVTSLYNEEHDFKTVVVDSADWAERLFWAQVCREKSVNSIEEIGYGGGYKLALAHWDKFLAGLDALRKKRGMQVILLAHAAITPFNNPDGENYDRYAPRLHRHASAVLQEWADEVLFATYKTYTRSADAGFGKKEAKGIGSGERVIKTTELPAWNAKNRLQGIPDEIPLAYAEYAKYLPQNKDNF